MGNSLRCCLSCFLPFGALDVVRVVHLNGHVEEIGRPVTAGEILRANPDHVLTKPCPHGAGSRILVLPPESGLRRGSIYFLIPDPSSHQDKKKIRRKTKKKRAQKSCKPCREACAAAEDAVAAALDGGGNSSTEAASSQKKPGHRRRRSGQPVVVWHPRLDSISEGPPQAAEA